MKGAQKKKKRKKKKVNPNLLPPCCTLTLALSYSNACDLYDLADNNRSVIIKGTSFG